MNFLHEVIEKNGQVFDTLSAHGSRLTVARLGAEMISLRQTSPTGLERGFFYRDGETESPDSGWGNHATVMGYFLHRLWEEKSLYRGQEIRGGNHGFLRHFAFPAPTVGDAFLRYEVAPEAIPPEAYPLRVRLFLTYTLRADGRVAVEFHFHNEEPELSAHVSFGLHPGWAVSSLAAARLWMAPGTYVRQMAPGNFLNGQTETIEHPGGEMPFAKEDLPGSFLLDLSGVPQPLFRLYDSAEDAGVELDLSECPYLTLWSDGGDFFCVEPCWGLPDSNPPTAFEQKKGIQVIAPRSDLKRGFTFRPFFGEAAAH
jgi:galactose mutarotase-like enzyme